jgi:excisionase family DNA binding protein
MCAISADGRATGGGGIAAGSPAPVVRPPVESRVYRQLFDRETLADYLRLSTDTIDRLVRANKLACVRIGSQVRFTLEDVEAFLERNRTDDCPAVR